MKNNEVGGDAISRISHLYVVVFVIQPWWAHGFLDAVLRSQWKGSGALPLIALSLLGWLAGFLCGRGWARRDASVIGGRTRGLLSLAGMLGGVVFAWNMGSLWAWLLPKEWFDGTFARILWSAFLPLVFLLLLVLEKWRGIQRLRRINEDLGLGLLLGCLAGVLGANLVFLGGKVFLLLGTVRLGDLSDLALNSLLPTGTSVASGTWLGLVLGRVFLHAQTLRNATWPSLQSMSLDSGRALGALVKRPQRAFHLCWSTALSCGVLSWILYGGQWESGWTYLALGTVPLLLIVGVWLTGKGISVVPTP